MNDDAKRAKPRGLYYADAPTRKRVAIAGGLARSEKIKQQKAEQALEKALATNP